MKLLFSVLLFVLTNTLRDVQIPDQNFLINGDFEQSKNGILPDYWNGDSKFYSWSSIAATGRHSLEYSNSDSSVYKLCLQTLNIKPGKNYTAGIKIKTVDISGNDYGASFCVEWLDGNGKYLGGAHPKGINICKQHKPDN